MIKHIKCDIFESGADIICHQVNCQGVMGSGIAKQVRERYPWVYEQYKDLCQMYSGNSKALLGDYMPAWIDIEEDRLILNIFGQENFGYDGKCYTDYDKLKKCFYDIAEEWYDKTIAIPYLMGCHRGGGDWNVVYKIIEDAFKDFPNDVLICEYNGD